MSGLTLVEGPKLVQLALDTGAVAIESVFAMETDHVEAPPSIEVVRVDANVIAKISTTQTPQSPVAVIRVPQPAPVALVPTIVAWQISDPVNVGAIIRSAIAFGVQVVIGPDCADPWGPKALRAAAGASFVRSPGLIDSLDDLGEFWIAAFVAAGGGAVLSSGDDRPVAALIGSESHGLPDTVLARADRLVTLSMAEGVESLNAGVTAGIVAFLLRGREGGLQTP